MKGRLTPRIFAAAAAIGLAAGGICVGVRLVLRLLQWVITGHGGLLADAAATLSLHRRALTPIAGAAIATVVISTGRRFDRRKPMEYTQAVRSGSGRIPWKPTFWRTASSCVSVSSGAAIGREGSMIQFACACIAKVGERLNRRDLPLADMVLLATAGAVAAVYQAPIAGVFFALEIAAGVRSWQLRSLSAIPVLLAASICGAMVSRYCLEAGPLFRAAIPGSPAWHDAMPVLALAVAFGIVGPGYVWLLRRARILRTLPNAIVWSAALVGGLSCLSPEVWGNGDSAILKVMNGQLPLSMAALVLTFRLVAVSACAGSGVVGGVFTPTVFAGSVAGLLLSRVAPGAVDGYAAVGIATLLASVTQAPLMSMFMAVELTGNWGWLPLAAPAALLADQIARRLSKRSLYAVATTEPVEAETPAQ